MQLAKVALTIIILKITRCPKFTQKIILTRNWEILSAATHWWICVCFVLWLIKSSCEPLFTALHLLTPSVSFRTHASSVRTSSFCLRVVVVAINNVFFSNIILVCFKHIFIDLLQYLS